MALLGSAAFLACCEEVKGSHRLVRKAGSLLVSELPSSHMGAGTFAVLEGLLAEAPGGKTAELDGS